MIRSKAEWKEYLDCEKKLYFSNPAALFGGWLMHSKFYRIHRFLRVLRCAEYHKNQNSPMHRLAYVWYHRRKNMLGARLGFEIPENTVGKGLMIYHIAPIVINEDARIGEYCCITGNFCVGNTGAGTASPVLGDHVTAGWGSCVIGDARVADHVTIGAGCVLTRSVETSGAKVAGVPGRVLGG